MLKTPKCPIWITNINGQIGLLFSINLDLVSDWRIENRFVLNYYTGLPTHPKCCLNIGKFPHIASVEIIDPKVGHKQYSK